MKKVQIHIAMLALGLLASFGSVQGWSYTLAEWPYKMPIILNTSASGANIGIENENFNKFPLLIRLNAQNFDFTQAKDNGSDLRFSRSLVAGSENERPYQIERWDKTNKVAEVWVLVDQIKGLKDNQLLYMHWGHSNPPAPLSTPVFDPDNSYTGVWHMGESGTTLNGSVLGRNGTKRGTNDPKQDAGQIGKAQKFYGSSTDQEDWVDLGTNQGYTNSAGSVTMEAWVKWDGSTSVGKIVGFSKNNSSLSRAQLGVEADGRIRLEARSNDAEGLKTFITSTANIPALIPGNWYYVNGFVKYESDAMEVCVNLTCQSQASVGFSSQTLPSTPSTYAVIGAEESKDGGYFKGTIEEVRISIPTGSRSFDWHRLIYESTKLNPTLVRYPGLYLPLAGGTMYGSINMNQYQLDNVGTVVTRKWKVPTPDYVFEEGYKVPSLESTKAFTKKNRHLPGIPSAKQMEAEGMDLATMNMLLLKQVEHLHLYMMEQEKRIRKMEGMLE